MRFFVRKDRMSELYEARIADLKAEHAKLVTVLADLIEHMRAERGLAQPVPVHARQLSVASGSPRMEPAHYMSEEEEDVRGMHEAGLIDANSLEAELAKLGIEIDN